MSDINFNINGISHRVDLSKYSSRSTLNTYLRSTAGLTGTKFMCLAGACGACLVSVREYDQVLAIHSCLKLLYTCDGLDLTTIEGIGSKSIGYHPIQRQLHRRHGTQCGFCSPGMIVNLYSRLEDSVYNMSRAEIEKSLVGITCRCTGYRAILDAFKSFGSDGVACEKIDDDIVDIEDLASTCMKSWDAFGTSCPKSTLGNITSIQCIGDQLWQRVTTVQQVFQVFEQHPNMSYSFVAAGTGKGVIQPTEVQMLIDISNVESMKTIHRTKDYVYLGGLVNIREAIETLNSTSQTPGYEYCKDLANHMGFIGNGPLQNVATIAGNLALKNEKPTLPFEIFHLIATAQALIEVAISSSTSEFVRPKTLLSEPYKGKLILGVRFPRLSSTIVLKTYRVALRAVDSFPYICAGFAFEFDEDNTVLTSFICYSGVNPDFINAVHTEHLAIGKNLFTPITIQTLIDSLVNEIQPYDNQDQRSASYRKHLAISLFYRFVLDVCPPSKVSAINRSGSTALRRPLSSGMQTFSTNRSKWPLTQPILKYEGLLQSSGEADYSIDLITQKNELSAAFAYATKVHSTVARIDASEALKLQGVRFFISAKNVTGANAIIPPYKDFMPEQLFLDVGDRVRFHGQPIGVILADSMLLAYEAVEKVRVIYANGQTILGSMISPLFGSNKTVTPNLESLAEVLPHMTQSQTMTEPNQHIRGRLLLNGHYHYHMENQTAIAVPAERGYTLYCSTTFIDYTQVSVSLCLGIPSSQIFMPLPRIGGSFGAKEKRSIEVACAATLAAHITKRPIRFVMSLEANMRTIGKRIGALGDYSVDFDRTGRILKLVHNYKQDVGITTNDFLAFLYEVAFPNVYDRSNWTYTGEAVKTDSPCNTMFRAPGALTAIAMSENIMEHIAYATGRDPVEVRLANIEKTHQIRRMWDSFKVSTSYERRRQECEDFNAANRWKKRGFAVSMMGYTAVFKGGQAVFVSVYHFDGSVVISHGGIENGQGLNTKALQVVALALGVPIETITVRPTDNVISANATFTGASMTHTLVCNSFLKACEQLLDRMKPVRDTMKPGYTWAELTEACHLKQIDLRATYHMSESDFAPYLVNGLAAAEMEVDILTGAYQCLRADIMEDPGESMNPAIDIGQLEGGFVMGMGYWLTEELCYDRTTGRLISNRAFNYKVPGALDIPVDFRVTIWDKDPNPYSGVIRAKAIGEPPICLGVVTMFALRNALMSARKDAGIEPWIQMGSGNTPEKVFMFGGTQPEQYDL